MLKCPPGVPLFARKSLRLSLLELKFMMEKEAFFPFCRETLRVAVRKGLAGFEGVGGVETVPPPPLPPLGLLGGRKLQLPGSWKISPEPLLANTADEPL